MRKTAISLLLALALVGCSEEEISKQEPVKEPAVEKKEDKPEKKVSVDDKIKKAAKPGLGKVSKIEINDDLGTGEGKIVLVTVKQDGVSKKAVNYETTRSLKKLFKIDDVNQVTYFWQATLVDTAGNEKVETVGKVQMNKDTASSINWDNFSYNNLEEQADNYNAHPALQ